MALTECGLRSLPELLLLLIIVFVCSEAVALFWIWYVEEIHGEHIDLMAIHSLDIIIGFLYHSLVTKSITSWKQIMSQVNQIMLISHSILMMAKGQSGNEYTEIVTHTNSLRNKMTTFFENAQHSLRPNFCNYLCCGISKLDVTRKAKLCLGIRQEMNNFEKKMIALEETTNNKPLFKVLKNKIYVLWPHVEDLEKSYFVKEPACFKWHLRLLLFLYFFVQPLRLFSAYGRTGTLILYPIIIYGLFSVAILASVFDNPVKHPELSVCYEQFQKELKREEVAYYSNNNMYLRQIKFS
tara:strand:+ start:613 stop:1500 length:888 start_codon:yes stop_codon:yes gene_type:complete